MLDLLQQSAPAFMDLLAPETAEMVKKTATLVSYSDGQLIQGRGDDKPGISIVRSGAAHAGIHGLDGSFLMTSILGPGQTFGEFTLFAGLPRTHDITASGPTQIDQIIGSRFLRLYERQPEISRALLQTSLTRTHLLLEMLEAMRRLPLRERTAKILLAMSQVAGDPGILECRQSDLAYTLGVSRLSVGKALKLLETAGLIVLGYRQIKIPRPDLLADWVAQHSPVTPVGLDQ